MILTCKRLLVDVFSLAEYRNNSNFVSLQELILSPDHDSNKSEGFKSFLAHFNSSVGLFS